MENMFHFCSSLQTLDVSKFRTGYVENMEEMFKHCSSLENLDLSNYKTYHFSMTRMFNDCFLLRFLNITNFKKYEKNELEKLLVRCDSLMTIETDEDNAEWNCI